MSDQPSRRGAPLRDPLPPTHVVPPLPFGSEQVLGGIHAFGSGCFFVFGVIYFLFIHSTYLLLANFVFGTLCAANWYVAPGRLPPRVRAHVFLGFVYLGLVNVAFHLGVGVMPMVMWGLSVAIASAFIFELRGILGWSVANLAFYPLVAALKHLWPARVIGLEPWQTELLAAATYVGLLSFLVFTFLLFRRRLDATLGNLEGALQDQRTLVRVLCHDLSNRTTAIRLWADELVEQLPEAGVQDLRSNSQALVRAVSATEDILRHVAEYAGAQAGRISVRDEVVDARAAVDECLVLLERQGRAKDVRFEVLAPSAPGSSLVHFARENLVHQVLMNVLTNAVKFSPPNGRVTIAVTPEVGGRTLLSVSDEGQGMEAPVLDAIRQARAVPSRHGTAGELGTGLGLRIARAYLDKYAVDFDIECLRAAKGTTVTLRFPAPPGSARPVPAP